MQRMRGLNGQGDQAHSPTLVQTLPSGAKSTLCPPVRRCSFDVSMLSSGQNMLQSVFGQLPTDIRETKVPVEHCCIGQHELRWDKEITTSVDGRVMELQPGTANLQRVRKHILRMRQFAVA
eukprot:5721645-Prymnesium_polylepis.1